MSAPPLTQADRTRVYTALHAMDPALADRVADILEPDPVVRAVDELGKTFSQEMRHLEASLSAEARTTRLQTLAVVLLAMAINAGMVGLGLSVGGTGIGTVTVTPADRGESVSPP